MASWKAAHVMWIPVVRREMCAVGIAFVGMSGLTTGVNVKTVLLETNVIKVNKFVNVTRCK